MQLSINGTITKKEKAEKGTSKAGKEWIKQTFVIDSGDQYNPEVAFSVFGEDKVNNLKNFKKGEQVEVHFNVSSREFNGKYYHNLDAWRIVQIGAGSTTVDTPADEDDDLPF